MNNSNRFFLDSFTRNFKTFLTEGTPVALYGVGEKTKLLLENREGINVVGLLDKDAVGRTLYGEPVLSYEEVVKKTKHIIIVANMSISPLIYQRIEFLRKEHGIDILYINGTRPPEIEESDRNKHYSKAITDDLRKEIDNSEVVSFDLFDTLIMRKVLAPTDIFDLVERTLRENHHLDIEFRNKRIEAEHYCYREKDRYCTIHDIYDQLTETLHCNAELANTIKEIEFQTELRSCIPRTAMLEYYEYAKKQGKILLITTDTFFTKAFVLLLLDNCGIKGFTKLLISCEEKRLKYLGDMWQHVNTLYEGRRILHIGDNQTTDINTARKHHVNTFKIESAVDILANSRLGRLCKSSRTLDESVLLGHLAARFLNDPFVLFKNGGRLPVNSLFDLGYLSFGPLVLSFLLWLIRKTKECKIDKLLFFARDGYVLHKIYSRMAGFFRADCAEAIYFLTSRRAASVAAINVDYDIAFIVQNVCKINKVRFHQLLSTAFGVLPDPGDPMAQKICYETTQEELVEHIIGRYRDRILRNAESERHHYLNYISTLGLEQSDKIGCVNFVGRGITQRFVSDLMERELLGFYFAKEIDMLDIFNDQDQCHALYDEYISPHSSRSNLAMKFIFGEVVFSSPDEQLVKFDEHGQPVFEIRDTIRDFGGICECQTGIENFVEDMMAFDKNLLNRDFPNDTMDLLYGLFSDEGCVCSDEIKQSFIFHDYYSPDIEIALSVG